MTVGGTFNPADYGTVRFWLRPEDISGAVGAAPGNWIDASGNSRTFTEEGSGLTVRTGPSLRKVVQFGSTGRFMRSEADLFTNNECCLLIVGSFVKAGNVRIVIDSAADSAATRHNVVINSNTIAAGTDVVSSSVTLADGNWTSGRWSVFRFYFNGASSQVACDGRGVTTGTIGSTGGGSVSPTRIGARFDATGTLWLGSSDYIGEMVMFGSPNPASSAVAAAERALVNKWGIDNWRSGTSY